MAFPVPVGYFETSITNKILAGATEIPIDSVVDKNGNSLDGLVIALVADRGETFEETFIGTVSAAQGKVVSVTGGIDPLDGQTSRAGLKFDHGTGHPIEMTAFPYVTRVIRSLNGTDGFDGAEWTDVASIAGLDTPDVSEATKAANVQFVIDTYSAGGVDASTTNKGLVQIATAAQLAAGTDVGSTGAKVVASGGSFKDTSSAAVLVPVTNNSGKLSDGFGGAASSLATLDGSSKVVQNPASASATAAVNTIPISPPGTSVLADGFQTVIAANAAVLTGNGNANSLHHHEDYVGDLGQTADGAAVLTTTQDVSLSVDVGFVPVSFEAIVSGDIASNRAWDYNNNANIARQAAFVKGKPSGALISLVYGKNDDAVHPNVSPILNPFSATSGVYSGSSNPFISGTTASPGLATLTPTAETSTLVFKNVVLSGTTLTFTWTFTKGGGGNNCGVRIGVHQLSAR